MESDFNNRIIKIVKRLQNTDFIDKRYYFDKWMLKTFNYCLILYILTAYLCFLNSFKNENWNLRK